jgi:hypothetical protein
VLTAAFWLDLLERVVRTAAQAGVALIPATTAGWLVLDWRGALLTVGSAAVACVLTAIVAAPVNVRGSASFLPPLPRNRHERAA